MFAIRQHSQQVLSHTKCITITQCQLGGETSSEFAMHLTYRYRDIVKTVVLTIIIERQTHPRRQDMDTCRHTPQRIRTPVPLNSNKTSEKDLEINWDFVKITCNSSHLMLFDVEC